MAMAKPSPSAPMRLATGTRQFSNVTVVVGWLFQPSLRSLLPKARPGLPFSTAMHEMPLGPAPPVRAITR